MRQVRPLGQLGLLGPVGRLGPVGLLRPLGRLGLVGRGETPSANWLATVCGFCHNSLNRHNRLNDAGEARHNRLNDAGQAQPAALGEVPCV